MAYKNLQIEVATGEVRDSFTIPSGKTITIAAGGTLDGSDGTLIGFSGAGDMTAAAYDTNGNTIVDNTDVVTTNFSGNFDNDTDHNTSQKLFDILDDLSLGGGGSGTVSTIKEDNSQVGGSDIVTLDFLGADFDLAESPDTEIQIVIAAAIARDAEVAAAYQPLEATLTDIADGTITEDLVNTANPWADNEVSDTITVGASGSVNDAAIPAGITRDTEWDTIAEIETATSVNIIVSTEIDTAAELNTLTTDTDMVLDTDIGSTVQAYDADLDDLADGSLTGTKVAFADTNSDFTATNVQAAIEELVSVNGSGPNAGDGKVSWTQLVGVPAGFADGSDDGSGGGSGTVSTIKEDNSQVGGSDIVTLDFLGADFDLAESPDTEIQIVIAAAIARDAEVAAAYQPLDTDLTTLAGNDGSALTGVDAATGDSATAFFDAGTIEHERGGLEADVAAYSGIPAITSGATYELNTISELETAVGAVNILLETEIDASSELAALMDDETGSGALVFATSPTLVTPALGTPSSGTVTNLTGTASININGTVGATTPTTGAFTFATGTATLAGNPALGANTASPAANGIIFEGSSADDFEGLLTWPITASDKTITLQDATGTLYQTGGTDVAVADGGTGRSTSTTAYGLIAAGTTATGAHQTLAAGATTEVLVGGGASALPVWTTATGTGAPVRATSPTLVTPAIGAATATTASAADNDTSVATTAFVQQELDTKALVCFPLTIESLDDGFDFALGYVPAAFTINRMVFVHAGAGLSSPSTSVTVRQGTDRSDTGTAVVTGGTTATSSTTGTVVTSFDDATCPAGSFLWIETASTSGTTANFEVFVFGTYD